MEKVFTITMLRRGRLKGSTMRVGADILSFDDNGVAETTNPDTAKQVRQAFSTIFRVDDSDVVGEPVPEKAVFAKPLPKIKVRSEDVPDLASDEDLTGIAVGMVVDGDDAAAKIVVAVKKKKSRKKRT